MGRYEAGSSEAVDELLAWPPGQIREVVASLDRADVGWRATDFEAAALLHTDLAWRILDVHGIQAMSFHLQNASRILAAGGPAVADFSARWYAAVADRLRLGNALDPAETLLAAGRTRLPGNAVVLYESALTAETLALSDDRSRAARLAQAEAWLRAATVSTPSSERARLHLGYVLLLEQKDDEALQILDALYQTAHDVQVRYAAELFAGAICERRGRLDEASRDYFNAIREFPGQAAYVALSEVLERNGRMADAQLIMHELVDHSSSTPRIPDDPYGVFASLTSDTGARLADLRAEVREAATAAGGQPAAAPRIAVLALSPERTSHARAQMHKYAQIVRAYRWGRGDPIDQLLRWSSDDLDAIVAVYTLDAQTAHADVHQIEAAAMLHTDAAWHLSGDGDVKAMSFHLDAAGRILAAGGEGVRGFAERWYEAVARRLRYEEKASAAEEVLAAARVRLANDATVLYESGLAAEVSGSGAAAVLFRQALAAGSPPDATRLHLGRVLMLAHHDEEARAAFDRVHAHATDPQVGYLAALFGGALAERRGDFARAARLYGEAIEADPSGQSASVALSELRRRQGRPEDAARALRDFLVRSGVGAAGADPTWLYAADTWNDLERMMGDLRTEARQ
ncbi:MAG TPA: tetratricopeptide repeat protein [Vicinamibacterales bacterium]|nr:tetratricopeptide repeat protein [Vicinamibacterales bacterium]